MTGFVPLKLPRLLAGQAIVDKDGKPTREYTRYFDEHCTLLEDAINGIISIESQISDGMGAVAELRSDIEELRRLITPREDLNKRLIEEVQLLQRPT